MLTPIRSLTEADGFMLSSFITIRATQPSAWDVIQLHQGVRPINSVHTRIALGSCWLLDIQAQI